MRPDAPYKTNRRLKPAATGYFGRHGGLPLYLTARQVRRPASTLCVLKCFVDIPNSLPLLVPEADPPLAGLRGGSAEEVFLARQQPPYEQYNPNGLFSC
ncbi:MAG TPA: hypothetical protein VJZ02_04760 [Candidatus Brocadiales bacterium]|nr:hypothetical protein [Candidatus Brocadiales bacterium]